MILPNLKQARKAAGLTQADLAERVGLNRATISKYESGGIDLSIKTICDIATALGVHPLYLLDGVDENGGDAVQQAVKNFLDKEIAEEKKSHIATITALFAQLNGHGREKVISYAEGLADSPDYRANFGGD